MAFSAFFSGMEIAFVSVDKLRFEMERKSGVTSGIISYFLRNPNNFISTMLVGNNISLVIYGILMAKMLEPALSVLGNDFLMIISQAIIATVIVLFTGEFLPKTIFRINPNLWLRIFSWLLLAFYILLYPVSTFSSWFSMRILKLFGVGISSDFREIKCILKDLHFVFKFFFGLILVETFLD
jgi:CBS domain containing-hemolysin-like protein